MIARFMCYWGSLSPHKKRCLSLAKLSGSAHGAVILFGILGSYLFLHIWENILLKLGKYELKYMKLGK